MRRRETLATAPDAPIALATTGRRGSGLEQTTLVVTAPRISARCGPNSAAGELRERMAALLT